MFSSYHLSVCQWCSDFSSESEPRWESSRL